MHYTSEKNRIPLKDILYKVLIFLSAVALIVYFLPRDGKFNYQFDVNKPWKYGQLMATFDFPIYKDQKVINQEQDSLLKSFYPYFTLDEEVQSKVLETLEANSRERALPKSQKKYLNHIKSLLNEIYQKGVIASDELAQLRTDTINSIMLIEEKLAIKKDIQELFTVKDAYEYILNADTAQYKKEILRQFTINDYIMPNLSYEKEHTETAKKEMLESISWASGIVQSGQKIIDRGEIVTPHTYNILQSLAKESTKRSETKSQKHVILLGQTLFVGILMLCFMLYIDLFRKDYYKRKRTLLLLFLLVIFYCIITAIMVDKNIFHVYIIPYAMLPIIIRTFLDSRTALIAHLVTVLTCSIILRYPHDFILLQTIGGLVAIYSLKELSQRSQLIRSAFLVIISYALVYLCIELITENDLTKLNLNTYLLFVVNGILLLFTYPLLFLLEKTFGFTSNVTLVELSNINSPLLRRMSEVAPGTFQHSMQMANLAAEAAIHIGANSQLVRTGALYHDIGKMENPAFFTENQSGKVNPHKNLSYEESAQVVINHVLDGIKLADKNNLPKAIKDFITTHHGKGKTKYFYISWMNEHPDEQPNDELFTYPGPNPFSKETAILMMADGVEAASRSLPEYTDETITAIIDKIIDSQVEEGYFKDCPITFQDIATIKEVFKNKLKTIYHTRISYPELQNKK